MTDDQFNTQHYLFERMMRAIYDCPVPVVACLNGPAVAGGLELALGCDFIIASDRAALQWWQNQRGTTWASKHPSEWAKTRTKIRKIIENQ